MRDALPYILAGWLVLCGLACVVVARVTPRLKAQRDADPVPHLLLADDPTGDNLNAAIRAGNIRLQAEAIARLHADDDLMGVAEHLDVDPTPTYREQTIAEEIKAEVEMYDICRHRWPVADTDTDRQHHTMPHLCMVPAYLGVHEYHECVCGAGILAAEVAA